MNRDQNDKLSSDSKQRDKLDYQIIIADDQQLKLSYMPFIKNGALFIATEEPHHLNDMLTISVKLFDHPDVYQVEGKVIWVNPKFAQDSRPQGIGLQFLNKESMVLHDKIENLLAGSNGSSGKSETLSTM